MIESVLRAEAPRVLGALARRHGQFDQCEDAVQEALLAASQQWPADGVPDDPRAWLLTVATRRLTDRWRSESADRRRAELLAAQAVATEPVDEDDTLTVLYLCCHPKLSAPSQLALTLRAAGGLTTAEIARAFLVPEATMAQRISRAKRTLAGARFTLPPEDERDARLQVVLHVLYLVFTEGHTASAGDALVRTDLTAEAIRLTLLLRARLPAHGEVRGLLALMLLTDARRPARTDAGGALVPLAEQDRTRWNRRQIDAATALLDETLATSRIGPYQVQAAIAALHAAAPHADATDWPQIVALYELLGRLDPNPMVTLNHAVALAEAHGPTVGLAMLDELRGDERVAGHHRVDAVRAHLLERAGDTDAAREHYLRAARRTTSGPEQRYLDARAARLA